jgi:hypothetical protein
MAITGARVFEIAPEKARQEISPRNPDVFDAREKVVPVADVFTWRFPARSVSAVELTCGA